MAVLFCSHIGVHAPRQGRARALSLAGWLLSSLTWLLLHTLLGPAWATLPAYAKASLSPPLNM